MASAEYIKLNLSRVGLSITMVIITIVELILIVGAAIVLDESGAVIILLAFVGGALVSAIVWMSRGAADAEGLLRHRLFWRSARTPWRHVTKMRPMPSSNNPKRLDFQIANGDVISASHPGKEAASHIQRWRRAAAHT